MRYEGNAPQYSAFAIIAIESVWPNPEGNELSPDDTDMALLGATKKPFKSRVKASMAPSRGVETEDDHHGKQGYYKVIPLNVVRLETSSSVDGGSSFTASFTLDDILLALPEGSEAAFRHATGIPLSRNHLIKSDFYNALPQLLDSSNPGGIGNANWTFVRDSDLGLSRYRVTGAHSAFNLEDLVGVNDTVTIWIYHDPSDFYLKDEVPEFRGDVVAGSNDIAGIIGSGSRQNQFSSGERSFDETMLFELGLINDTIIDAMELSKNPDERLDQLTPVSRENIYDVVFTLSREAFDGLPDEAVKRIPQYVDFAFAEIGETERRYISNQLLLFRAVDTPREGAGDNVQRLMSLRSIIENLSVNEDGDFIPPTDPATISELSTLGFDDPERFALSLTLLKNSLNKKAANYAHKYLDRKNIFQVTQHFSNGRKIMLTKAHGETPYLALKGVVTSIHTAIGTVDGVHTVTVTGSGYENVLTSTQVFWEDLLFPETTHGIMTEFNAVYMNISPPRAIHQMISRWAARQVVFGRLSDFSLIPPIRVLWVRQPQGREEGEAEDPEQPVPPRSFPGAKEPETFPVRGNFIYSQYPSGDTVGDPSFIRVFSPINYLDTTRIREMSFVLDKSYRDPSVEAAFNSAQMLRGNASIMENVRAVGGVANFYEMFVDEAGRFRYRLRFEAMERTPDTRITPIVQDLEVLSSGTAFSHDSSQLVTVVDVRPIIGMHVTTFGGLAFIGRSTPPVGGMPIEGMEDLLDGRSISPDLFRYGLRRLFIEDIYQSEPYGARRKAHLYRMFYGSPLKRATVRLRNNTSYRIGETVLVCLQHNKRRSRALIDVNRMIEWLEYIKGHRDLLEMYIGIEKRFLQEGTSSFFFTGSSGASSFTPIPEPAYSRYLADPYMYVLDAFIKTLTFMKESVPDVNVFTPEYFPTTYWYHRDGSPGNFRNWDQGAMIDEEVISLYANIMLAAITGQNSAREKVSEILTNPRNQGIINAIRFQDFRVASYYIEGVNHRMVYGESIETNLQLNYGQDTLVLLEPRSFLPIGFLSLEKKMRIGYDTPEQRDLWHSYKTERSAMQNMYVNQFKEDGKYKKASFLHNAQYLRISSNYMYEIVNFYDPIFFPQDAANAAPREDRFEFEARGGGDSPALPSISNPTPTLFEVRGTRTNTIYDLQAKTRTVIVVATGETETFIITADEFARAKAYPQYATRREELLRQAKERGSDVYEQYRSYLTLYELNSNENGRIPSIEEAMEFVRREMANE